MWQDKYESCFVNKLLKYLITCINLADLYIYKSCIVLCVFKLHTMDTLFKGDIFKGVGCLGTKGLIIILNYLWNYKTCCYHYFVVLLKKNFHKPLPLPTQLWFFSYSSINCKICICHTNNKENYPHLKICYAVQWKKATKICTNSALIFFWCKFAKLVNFNVSMFN